jgi:hypothetical protein
LCFVSVLCIVFKFFVHGGHRGNTAHALAQWRHPVASSEALDVLHQEMGPASYHCIAMAIEIAIDLPALFVAVDSLSLTI